MKRILTTIMLGWLVSWSYTHLHGENDLLGMSVSYEVFKNVYLGVGGHVDYDIHDPFNFSDRNWRETITVSCTVKFD